ncbi:Plasmodium vivax Vir protein, putative [Plasmodium vivax]|uniref:Vir protein, putative n=1 Tax=Plasmodium vivax TaxID=5855 RepID=A0A1G4E9S9_PLAVI|nr:Plasmodium vivax Vir protein, putative [Plasmodium vivax]SCA59891.1 Plasmodium vivax Vir protein, putative [Plasmodium vivax]
MTCKEDTKEEIYDFFDNIDRYIKDGKSIEPTLTEVESFEDCSSFAETWGKSSGNDVMAKKLCNIFTSIYNKLKHGKANYKKDINYRKDFSFLNYWINWKKREGQFNESTCIDDFYTNIENHVLFILGFEFENTLIYDIDKYELNKMNKLYNLYEKYTKLNAVIDSTIDLDKESFLSLSTACCTDYNDANYTCNGGNNNDSKFCEKLKTFQSKYEGLQNKIDQNRPEYSDFFKSLSKCPNNKIISTAVTGSIVGLIPLLGVLYKFTPMGQMFRSKIGILNKDISNNDEEMIKMSLMEKENEPIRFHKGAYNIKYQSL